MLHQLPEELQNHIFSYLIPQYSDIVFKDYYPPEADATNCSKRYKVAFIRGTRTYIINPYRLLLSQIPKKNGKNRYYLTRELLELSCDNCGGMCGSMRYCHGNLRHIYTYSSTYIGNNLNYALIQFLSSSSSETAS